MPRDSRGGIGDDAVMADSTINDVSDTALWVAHYRAVESERPDALFRDPFAKRLMGERGRAIAQSMSATSAYTRQNVVVRTYIIDRFVHALIGRGVDTIVNLGAGLDARPYRLEFPSGVRWIEVDYPHMIERKTEILANDRPNVALERVPLDLADRDKRRALFARLAGEAKKAAILTEGVLPYLSPEDVSSLSEDLRVHPQFEFWICDYISPETYKYIRSPKRAKKMANAPFKFFPSNPLDFFAKRGWKVDDIQYIQKTTLDLGRPMPMPWYARLLTPFMPKSVREQFLKMSAYMILRRI
jgi:methyltransferase (TIGR00027 family)